MKWNVKEDSITFASQEIASTKKNITKREILSESSKIFDPLGLLSPVTVRSKILMQSLWKQKLEWDVLVPN